MTDYRDLERRFRSGFISPACSLEAADAIKELREERDEAKDLLEEAIQWLRASDLPCGMAIHRIETFLAKG